MKKWIVVAAVVVVVAAGVGYYGLSYYGSQRAEQEFETRVRPIFPPGAVSHGAIKYTPVGDRLDIDALAIEPQARGLKSVRIAHLAVGGVTSPRLDSLVATKVVLDSVTGNHAEFDEIAASGVDVPTFERLSGAAPAAASAVAPNGPPVQGLSLAGATLHSDQAEASVKRLALTGIKSPLPPIVLDSAATPEAMLAWLAAFTLDKAEIDDADLRTLGANAGHSSFHHVALDGVAPGRIGAIALDAVAVEAKEGQAKVGSLALAGIAYRARSDKARASAALLGLPNAPWMPGRVFFERFAIGDVAVGVIGAPAVGLKDVHAAMAGTIAQATAFDLQLNEFSLDLTKLPPSPYGFDPTDLGVSRLVMNVDVKSNYDPAAKTMEVPHYAFVFPKLGSLTMALSLGISRTTTRPTIPPWRCSASSARACGNSSSAMTTTPWRRGSWRSRRSRARPTSRPCGPASSPRSSSRRL